MRVSALAGVEAHVGAGTAWPIRKANPTLRCPFCANPSRTLTQLVELKRSREELTGAYCFRRGLTRTSCAFFGSPREMLILLSKPENGLSGLHVVHCFGERTHFVGTAAPMLRIINVRRCAHRLLRRQDRQVVTSQLTSLSTGSLTNEKALCPASAQNMQ